jgi:hypothetical protein
MTIADFEQEAPPAPEQRMAELLFGMWVAQAIAVFARLRIADVLAAGPKNSEQIAQAIDADGPSVHRLLRALTDPGLVTQDGDVFALEPLGATLRTDVEGSWAAFATMIGMPYHRAAWSDLYTSVKSGEPAFARVHGKPVFEYLRDHPPLAQVFDAAMTSVSRQIISSISTCYDFGGIGTIVDVGGGRGQLLASILAAHPDARGVLFDLPSVIATAQPLLERAGVADRCTLVAGDFFEQIPQGGDAYLMSNVIHDWNDDKSELILRRCREAMPEAAVLLLLEVVLPDGPDPHLGKIGDLEMFVQTEAGRQRTRAEFADLLSRAGLELTRVLPGPGSADIVEALAI